MDKGGIFFLNESMLCGRSDSMKVIRVEIGIPSSNPSLASCFQSCINDLDKVIHLSLFLTMSEIVGQTGC